MPYVLLALLVLAFTVVFWKSILLIVLVVSAIAFAYHLFAASQERARELKREAEREEARNTKMRDQEEELEKRRCQVAGYLEAEKAKILMLRGSMNMIDWKSVEVFDDSDETHLAFMFYIGHLVSKIIAELAYTRGGNYEFFEEDLFEDDEDSDKASVRGDGIKHENLAMFYIRGKGSVEGRLSVSHNGVELFRSTWKNDGVSKYLKTYEVRGRTHWVEIFRAGQWIDTILSLEPEVNAILAYKHNEQQKHSRDQKLKAFGRLSE